jgi:hypothetical protein
MLDTEGLICVAVLENTRGKIRLWSREPIGKLVVEMWGSKLRAQGDLNLPSLGNDEDVLMQEGRPS